MKLDDKIYKQMLDHLAEAVYFVDTRRRILYWNRAAEVLTGYAADEVVGHFCFENILKHVDEQMVPLCEGRCPLVHAVETGQAVEKRVFLSHRKGHRVPVNVKVIPITSDGGTIIGAVELFSDASAFLEVEQLNVSLQNLIRIDPLTQLPNRRAVMEALEHEYQRYLRYSTVVGRFGGEEFMILLAATDSPPAFRIAEHLRAHLAGLVFPGTGSTITVSLGVTAVHPGDSLDSLLDRVDTAMYRSKEMGRNRVTVLE
ncbi:MAG: diguanylate cyclase [Desulfuromonadales bacterium]